VGGYNKAEIKLLQWFKQAATVEATTDDTVVHAKVVKTDQLDVEFNPPNGWRDRIHKDNWPGGQGKQWRTV